MREEWRRIKGGMRGEGKRKKREKKEEWRRSEEGVKEDERKVKKRKGRVREE